MKIQEALQILNWSTKWMKWLRKYLLKEYDSVHCSYRKLDQYAALHYGVYLMADHNHSGWW